MAPKVVEEESVRADSRVRTLLILDRWKFNDVKRITSDLGIPQNKFIEDCIEKGICESKNTSSIKKAVEDSEYIFGVDVNELEKRLKNMEPLNVYKKVYLALKLSSKKRTKLFLHIWPNELDEICMIDEVLNKSTEVRNKKKYFNIKKIANNFSPNITLSIFGEEYLKGYLKDEDYAKLKEFNPNIFISLAEREEEEPIEEDEPIEEEPIYDETLEAEILEPEEE